MKKIVLLLFISLLITGCYDYQEINDLNFISSIGIDYDNGFILTFEILNDTKTSKETSLKSYTLTSSGPTIAKAFDNMALIITKIPFYNHLKIVIISKEIAQNNMEEIVDFFSRNPNIRNEFYLIISENASAKDILNNKDENNPIIGTQLYKLISTNIYEFTTTYNKPFEAFFERILDKTIDPVTSVIKIDENKKIMASGIATFKDYKYKDTLSLEESSIFNILSEEDNRLLIEKEINGKKILAKLYYSNVSYKIENNTIYIDLSLEGQIVQNNTDLNLKKEKVYIFLNDEYSKIIKNKIIIFIDTIKKNNTDILGFSKIYYKKTRKINKDILKLYDVNIKTEVKINKKGLIFDE